MSREVLRGGCFVALACIVAFHRVNKRVRLLRQVASELVVIYRYVAAPYGVDNFRCFCIKLVFVDGYFTQEVFIFTDTGYARLAFLSLCAVKATRDSELVGVI